MGKDTRDSASKRRQGQDKSRALPSRPSHVDTGQQQAAPTGTGVQSGRSRVHCSVRDSDPGLLSPSVDDDASATHPNVGHTMQEPASCSTLSVSSRGGSATTISGVDVRARGHRRRGSGSGGASLGPGDQRTFKEEVLLGPSGPHYSTHITDIMLKAMSKDTEDAHRSGSHGPSLRLSQEASSLWRACGSLAGSLAGSGHDTTRWRLNDDEQQGGRDNPEAPRVERLHHRKSRTDELGDSSTRNRTRRTAVGSVSSVRARDSPFTGVGALQVGMGLLSADAKTLLEGKRARLSTVALAPWALSPHHPAPAGTATTSSAGVQTVQTSPKNSSRGLESGRTGGRSSARSSSTQQQQEDVASLSRGPSSCRIHSQTCSQSSASRPSRLRPRSMLPPAAPPQPAPRRRLATPDAPVASAAPTAPPCPAALKACAMSTTCEHGRSPEVAAPRAPLVGLAAWLWSVPEDARAHLHDALHAVAALMGEQQAAATQAEARAEQIQEEHSPPEKDRLSQAVSQAVSQAMSRAVSQAVALLGAHEQERKECCKGVEVPVPPKALETLLLATERCPGLQSVSPWSSKSIVNLDNAILTLATPSLSVKRLHENRPECPSVRPSAPLSLVAQDSTAALAAAPRAGPVRHQSLSPNPPAEALGLRASPPSLVVSRHSSGHSGWNSVDSGPSPSAPPAPPCLAGLAPPAVDFAGERRPDWPRESARPPCLPRSAAASSGQSVGRISDLPLCLVQPPVYTAGPSSAPSDLASGILGDESNTVEDSTAGSVGTIARVSSRPSRHIGVLAVPGADESIAIVPKGPLELDRVVPDSESPCTSTGLVITEQVDSQDEVLEALLDRLPSVGSAALVAMATEGMATALVDEDVDESGSGAVVEREDNVVEDPPSITCESVDSEVYAVGCGRIGALGCAPLPPQHCPLPCPVDASFEAGRDAERGLDLATAGTALEVEVPVPRAPAGAAGGGESKPLLEAHSSQNLEPSDVQSIAICTVLDHLNALLDNFTERPENRRRSLLEKELERRLLKMLDRTQARVHDQLVPTARKFACSVSYWMETYLLRAEDKLATRQ